jgi:hypothetical protein
MAASKAVSRDDRERAAGEDDRAEGVDRDGDSDRFSAVLRTTSSLSRATGRRRRGRPRARGQAGGRVVDAKDGSSFHVAVLP